jgi:peroxiredoxin
MANGGIGRWIGGLCVGLAALCVGCSGGQKASPGGPGQSAGQAGTPSSAQPGSKPTTADDSQPAAGEAPAPAPAAPPSIPKVYLTEEQRKSSRVGVGDSIPDASLADLAGQTRSVRGLFGKRLTVLVFFHAGGLVDRMRSKELLQDLDRDVVAAHGKQGMTVVAVDVGDSLEKVKDLAGDAHVGYPVLLDADGAYFAKLASGGFPRIYALDPTGKVLWFDLEYSTTTRYSLKQTLLSVLGESSQGF